MSGCSPEVSGCNPEIFITPAIYDTGLANTGVDTLTIVHWAIVMLAFGVTALAVTYRRVR